MMSLCAKKHDVICFDTRDCPFCEKLAEIAGLEADLSKLEEQ